MIEYSTVKIEGFYYFIAESGNAEMSVFWAAGGGERSDVREVPELVGELLPDAPFRLIGFTCGDWDRDLSPWKAPGAVKNQSFSGGGQETLSRLTGEGVLSLAHGERFIAGYSLGGLFALWALYESGVFSGAASASGSLWFPGWEEYSGSHPLPDGAKIYLSLGDREERAKNPVLASVGDKTRRFSEKYAAAPLSSFKFEWNEGNHFANPSLRLAKGISWLLKSSQAD